MACDLLKVLETFAFCSFRSYLTCLGSKLLIQLGLALFTNEQVHGHAHQEAIHMSERPQVKEQHCFDCSRAMCEPQFLHL